jgi:hypothetical protein
MISNLSPREMTMPYASCDSCDRIYVVPDGRTSRDECPICARPMRPTSSGETVRLLEALQQRGWQGNPPVPAA